MEFLGSGIAFGGIESNGSLPNGYEFKNLTIDRVSCIKIYTFTLQIGFGQISLLRIDIQDLSSVFISSTFQCLYYTAIYRHSTNLRIRY